MITDRILPLDTKPPSSLKTTLLWFGRGLGEEDTPKTASDPEALPRAARLSVTIVEGCFDLE